MEIILSIVPTASLPEDVLVKLKEQADAANLDLNDWVAEILRAQADKGVDPQTKEAA